MKQCKFVDRLDSLYLRTVRFSSHLQNKKKKPLQNNIKLKVLISFNSMYYDLCEIL